MALWFLCDPMFPQLFQRFLAARDERALQTTMLLYPLVTGVLFFLPVAVGVMGHLVVPGLEGAAADKVLPMVVARVLPPWVGALALVGALAALMSTMDSQLLTLSSMVVRDGAALAGPGRAHRVLRPRLVLAALAGVGLALALRPWAPILEVATETFTGLAVLFPVTLAMLYWSRTRPGACFAAILVGEALVGLYHFHRLPTFGLLPVIPVTAATTLVLVAGTLWAPDDGREPLARFGRRAWAWVLACGGVFALGHDFWAWGRVGPVWSGLPGWVWYFFGLNLLLAGLFLALGRGRHGMQLPDGSADH
jgi:SSS family solute:Na+ symporter